MTHVYPCVYKWGHVLFWGGEKSGFGIDVKVVIGVTVEGTIGSVTFGGSGGILIAS